MRNGWGEKALRLAQSKSRGLAELAAVLADHCSPHAPSPLAALSRGGAKGMQAKRDEDGEKDACRGKKMDVSGAGETSVEAAEEALIRAYDDDQLLHVEFDDAGRVHVDAVVDSAGLGLVHYAAMAGHVEAVALLVDEYGAAADASLAPDGLTPMFSAMLHGRWAMMELLLTKYGADPCRGCQGNDATLLHVAAKLSYVDICGLLSTLEAALPASASTATVDKLLAARITAGLTPLHVAVLGANTRAISALLAASSAPAELLAAQDTLRMFTPLHLAVLYGLPLEVFEALAGGGVAASGAARLKSTSGLTPRALADALDAGAGADVGPVVAQHLMHYAYDEALARGAASPGAPHVAAALENMGV
ncbi:uncharacterized protein AMSG_02430 [Thecamonas trahens ATCC 50062]|uniref:Uncharacterized protein n=1 Tax=Thecamonas trahens ATCC 50062 TaxID=461836 RepID=A0A0L0DWJ4_THETB|nr:hypothetical protein AMSG_02430 [Thecamonas trahens ATCC 50062]KNC56461.1 hypothetical protein AMSG_02430 [Thecamonas trahens ATCC 50062]|eukprot:XP_013760971.1 hypothetical protein AMSG_02430 [Thecamonas trahens ATCC 50062]